MQELLQIYEVKPEEIETIFLDLYGKYEKWYYLTVEERDRTLIDNGISNEEINIITELSNDVVKYKNMHMYFNLHSSYYIFVYSKKLW